MAKNILIFSDGTGQGAKMPAKRESNIRKLFLATDKAAPGRQIAFYDPGLGAAQGKDNSWWRWGHDLLSTATGLGISRNIKDCYDALIDNYEPNDRIYLFGFSRGAYTVRSLGGVLSFCGIPVRDGEGRSPKGRSGKTVRKALVEEAVEKVYKHYGSDEATKAERRRRGEDFRNRYGGNLPGSIDPPVPYFIGVFDTVRALGIPGSSDIMGWRHEFHGASLNPRVLHARHALSIDENRAGFEPVPWDETETDRNSGRIKQRWFPGVRSDVGGGYAECKLSDLTLAWMIGEATSVPDPIIVDQRELSLDPGFGGMQHDERSGFGLVWIEGTRDKWGPLMKTHETPVGQRFHAAAVPILARMDRYRPKALRGHPDYGPP